MGEDAPKVGLGYVILYVEDVEASLAFYERAFGLARRFFHDEEGKAYGELETGGTRLSFASLGLVASHFSHQPRIAAPGEPPLGFEIALTTPDVLRPSPGARPSPMSATTGVSWSSSARRCREAFAGTGATYIRGGTLATASRS